MPDNPFSSASLANGEPSVTSTDPATAPAVNPFSRQALKLSETDPLSKIAVRTGIVQDPMRAARILRAQDRLKLPADLVDRNLDTIEQQMDRMDFDPEAFAQTSPIVSKWLAEQPEHMAISKNDLPRLARLEQLLATSPKYRLTPTGGVLESSEDGKYAFPYASVQEFYATEYRGREVRKAMDAGERERRAKDLQSAFGPFANVAAGALQATGSTLESLQTGPTDPSKFAVVDATTQASQDLSPGIWGDIQRGAGGLAADVPLMLAGGPLGKGVQALAKLGRVRAILAPTLGKTGAKYAVGAAATAAAVQPLAIREGINTGKQSGAWNGLASWGIETVVPAAFGRTGVERALIPGVTPEVMALRRTAAKQFLVDAGLEGTEEAATEFAHAIHEAASGINPNALDGDQLARRLVVAGALGGLAGGAFNVPELVARMGEADQTASGLQFRQRMGQIPAIMRGQNTKSFMQELGQLATESEANKASPERVHQLIASMPDQGRSHIYVDPVELTAYAQSKGLDPRAFAQSMTEDPEVYDEAAITHAPMPVPVATYFKVIAGGPHHEAISQMAKLSPGDMTVAESDAHVAEIKKPAQVYTPEEQAAAQAASQSDAMATDPLEASGQKIHDDLMKQLEATGARPADAHIQALLYSEAFKTLGQRAGKDPFALYEPYRLKITRELPGIVQKGTTDYTDTLLDRLRKGEIPSEGKARGESLAEYLRRKGGLQDQGGELSAMDVNANRKPGQKNLIQTSGRLLDEAAQGAHEAGYIADSEPQTLLDAIREEAAGRPAYQAGAGDSQALALRDGLLELQDYLGRLGVDLQAQSNEEIKKLLLEQERSGQGGQTYNQSDPSRLWKTKTEEALVKLPNKGPSEQIRKTLINNGVNERELFWLGIDDLLKSKDTVTREEIAALVADPKVKMAETVKSLAHFTTGKEAREYIAFIQTMRSKTSKPLTASDVEEAYGYTDERDYITLANKLADENGLMKGNSAKFGAYVLPGGENYRELLITLPTDSSAKVARRAQLAEMDRNGPLTAEQQAEFDSLREFASGPKLDERMMAYRSSHWSEPNVLLHTRFNERQTADGEKVLHVEEIQSDWHQAGREKGYNEGEVDKTKLPANIQAKKTGIGWMLMDQSDQSLYLGGKSAWNTEAEAIWTYWNKSDLTQSLTDPRVPNAPFAKTWEEIGFKRMVRQAAEQGLTRITWTTGEQQAARYDLSKQVDQIRYKKNDDGSFDVWAANKDGGSLSDEVDWHNLKPEQIADKIGKDTAQRVVDGVGRAEDGDMVLEGVNLKIGGEGMKAAYDQRLVSIANKIGKKYGVHEQISILEDNDTEVHSLEITPEMARDAMGGMQLLFQPARGKIEIAPDRQLSITMLRHADKSTFLHETGHLFLEVLADLATAEDATPEIKAMWADVLQWLEVSDRSQIGTEQHEKWAEGFETYLMTGKAPSAALHTAFARFKAWLVNVYKKIIKGFTGPESMRIQLSPSITRVFDRILASDDAIAAAQSRQGTAATFTAASDAGMTEAEFTAYKASVEAARVNAEDRLRAQLMQVYQREATKQWQEERDQVRQSTADEVNQRREYEAISTLQSGTLPDGRSLPDDMQGLKLNRQEIVDTYGSDALMRLPGPKNAKRINKNNAGKYIYSDDGMSLAEAARLFGFRDGQALFEALVNAPDRRALIESTADRIMAESYPDPLTDGSIDERAAMALHNDMAADVLVAELRSLSTRTGQTPAPLELLRTKARERVATYLVKNLKPHRYEVAERTAFRRVEEALAKGDHREAFKQKQIQILNHEMFRAAQQAIDDAQAGYDYLKKFAEPKTRARIGKAGGWDWTVTYPDGTIKAFDNENDARAEVKAKGGEWDQTSTYLDQIDALLEQFQFTKESVKALKRRDSLRAWVEKQAADGQSVAISAALMDQVRVINWKEMTVTQINDLRDAVQSIAHLATFKNKLLKAQEKADFIEARDEALVQLSTLPKLKPAPRSGDAKGADAAKEKLDDLLANHRKLSSYARQMDGGEAGGKWWNLLVRSLNKSGDREITMRAEAAGAVDALWKSWKADGRNLKQIETTDGVGYMSRETRICTALNWGNEGNRARLLEGEKWTEAQGQAVVDSLDATDWALVQGTWDFINSYWSEIRSLEKRMNGVAPDKVEATPFITKFGVMRGGYYPIKYDYKRAAKSGRHLGTEALYEVGGATAATTKRGHTEERNKGTGKPLRLDVDVISQHVSQVVHDLTHREAIRDARKVLNDGAVRDGIMGTLGAGALKMIDGTIHDIAVSDLNDNATDRLIRYFRSGVSIASLAFNFTSASMQLTGVGQSMQLVGVGSFSRAVGLVASNPAAAWRLISEQSEFMRSRSSTAIREVSEVMSQVKHGAIRDTMMKYGFMMQQEVQRMVDMPTWLAAKENALIAGKSELDARDIADQAVIDSQGSGMTKDLSGVQRSRGPIQLFTVWYGPWNANLQRLAESYAKARSTESVPEAAFQLFRDHFLLITVPAVMSVLIRMAMSGGGDDSDKERPSLTAKILKEHVSMLTGSLTGIREYSDTLGTVAVTATMGKEESKKFPMYGYGGPAGTMGLKSINDLLVQLNQGEIDAGLVKAAIRAAGIFAKLPSGQGVKTGEALFDEDGVDLRRLLFGPPK